MSAEREKCPPFLSGTPFLAPRAPCFFSRSSLARACSPTPFHAEGRLFALPSIYSGESRFSSPSASAWHQSTSLCPRPPSHPSSTHSWWNQARQFNGGSDLIIYFPRVYGQLFFEHPASAPWFYDLAVMGLSDNPVSCFDVPSFGIFQPSGTRVPYRVSFHSPRLHHPPRCTSSRCSSRFSARTVCPAYTRIYVHARVARFKESTQESTDRARGETFRYQHLESEKGRN